MSLTIKSDASSVKKGLSKLTNNMRKVASMALHASVIDAVNRTRAYINNALPNKKRVAKALSESFSFNERRVGTTAVVKSFRQVKGEATYFASRKTADLAAIYNFGVKGSISGKGAISTKWGKSKEGKRRKGVTGGVMIQGGRGAGAHHPKTVGITKLPRGGGKGGFAMKSQTGSAQSWLPLHTVREVKPIHYMDYCAQETQTLFNYNVAKAILAKSILLGFYSPDFSPFSSGVAAELKRQSGSKSAGYKTQRAPRAKKSVQTTIGSKEPVKGASPEKKSSFTRMVNTATSINTKRMTAGARAKEQEADPEKRKSGKASSAMNRFKPRGGN